MNIKELRRVNAHLRKTFKRHKKRLQPEQQQVIEGALNDLHFALQQRDLDAATECYANVEQHLEVLLQAGKKSALREFAEPVVSALLVTLLLWAFVVEAFKIPSRSMVPTLLDGDHIFVNKLAYGLRLPFTTSTLIRFSSPARGDVVVFVFSKEMAVQYLERIEGQSARPDCAPPDNLTHDTEDKDYIKRVIGLPGDTVQGIDHAIYVNGEPIPRLELYRRHMPGRQGQDGDQVWVEEALGDHKYVAHYQAQHSGGNFGPFIVRPDHVFVMGDNRDLSFDSRCWGQVPISHIKGEALLIWWSNATRQGARWDRIPSRTP
jgi:signal peptidase I